MRPPAHFYMNLRILVGGRGCVRLFISSPCYLFLLDDFEWSGGASAFLIQRCRALFSRMFMMSEWIYVRGLGGASACSFLYEFAYTGWW